MTSKERKAARARAEGISAGLRAEVDAVNAAIRGGLVLRIPDRGDSLMSGRVVDHVRYGYDGMWVTMKSYGGSYALANDGRWDEIVKLAGLTRDPRTA